MIEINEATKNMYFDDSTEKQMVIEVDGGNDTENLNMYYGNKWNSSFITYFGSNFTENFSCILISDTVGSYSYKFTNYVKQGYFTCKKYLHVIFDLWFSDYTWRDEHSPYVGGDCAVKIAYKDGTTEKSIEFPINTDDFFGTSYMKFCACIELKKYNITSISEIRITNKSGKTLCFNINCGGYRFVLTNEENVEYLKAYTQYIEPLANAEAYNEYLGEAKPYIEPFTNVDLKAESFLMNEALCSADNLKFGLCESSYCEFEYFNRLEKMLHREINVSQYLVDKEGNKSESVPLGRYYVTSSQKQSSGGTKDARKIVAYDGLHVLNENSADWYTQYMFGVDTKKKTERYGYEYARQIFSTYYNFTKQIGIEKDEYFGSLEVANLSFSDLSNMMYANELSEKSWRSGRRIWYAKFTFSTSNMGERYYKVVRDNYNGKTDDQLWESELAGYKDEVDSLGRGALNKGSILIEEFRDNHPNNRYLVDSGDWFSVSDDVYQIDVRIPMQATSGGYLTNSVQMYKSNRTKEFDNGYIRLLYYHWSSLEIFTRDSGITGRDVLRSLLEPCGCFFKLDRFGKPQFKYCTKSGLYPSNTLYPKDTLFPVQSEGSVANGKYVMFDSEDYSVLDFGKIQIRKNSNDNENKSVVEWQYIGDETKENTYIIDDNIFYCHQDMVYEYDGMPEVHEMLQNMFIRICNMGYIPMDVQAVGMPWYECGDRIILLTENSGIESFIFARNLTGIQSLADNYEAKGDEKNPECNDFGYKVWKG